MEVSQEKKELGREKVIHKANRVCGRQAEGSPGGQEGWRAGGQGRGGRLKGRVLGKSSLVRTSGLGVPVIALKTQLRTVFDVLFPKSSED